MFNIPEGDKLFEFRRGMKGVEIFSLAFDQVEQFLVTSSNTGTVHVFSLTEQASEKYCKIVFFFNFLFIM